jgi:anti-sigma-K factor RskA
MPEESINGPDDEFAEIEALLREIQPADFERTEPPADAWAAIADDISSEPSGAANVTSLSGRRGLRRPLLAVAAAAALLVAGSVFAYTRDSGADVLATAVLTYDPVSFDPLGSEASATVSLIDDSSGLAISLDEASLPNDLGPDADLELWLIDADENGNVIDLVSLGDLDNDDDNSFGIPSGYDLAVYSVVDISVEPRDGDATHSGRSILRGMLSTS